MFQERYPVVRAAFPGEGRRKWCLRVIEEFWRSSEVQAEIMSAGPDAETNEAMDVSINRHTRTFIFIIDALGP